MDEKSFDAKRRNLILVSFFLVFIKYADAEINSSANISFLKIQIGNPAAIIHAVWVLWLYFLLRAYQHYSYYLKLDYQRSVQKLSAPLMHRAVAGIGIPDEHEMVLYEEMERFHKYKLVFRPHFLFERVVSDFKYIMHLARRKYYRKRSRINLLRKPKLRYSGLARYESYGEGDAWRIVVWTVIDRSLGGGGRGKMPLEMVAKVGVGYFHGAALFIRMQTAMIMRSAPFFECRLPFIIAIIPVF
ncbi:hypothetical protein, partial [Xanthomonas arboricola]|uniref:hypothetical protein n=1 Tax=Xanthomonas arboricola TaxID=56448 RepID=UPI000AC1EA47